MRMTSMVRKKKLRVPLIGNRKAPPTKIPTVEELMNSSETSDLHLPPEKPEKTQARMQQEQASKRASAKLQIAERKKDAFLQDLEVQHS